MLCLDTAVALVVLAVIIGTLWAAVDPIGALERGRASVRNVAPQPAPLSAEEKEQIHKVRAVWNLYGERAGEALVSLFNHAVPYDSPPEYWMELLRPKRDGLKTKMLEMTDALHYTNALPFATVQGRLNEFYKAYVHLAAWVAKLDEQRDIALSDDALKRPLEQWIAANVELSKQLWEDLHERPEHKGKLLISYSFASRRAAMLMRAKHIADLSLPNA